MADLTTIAGIEAELAVTADYDMENDVSKAKRRVAALRRKLDFPAEFRRDLAGDEQSAKFAMQAIENQIAQAIAFVQANVAPSEAQQLANPSVLHADFSTLRGYSPGGCE